MYYDVNHDYGYDVDASYDHSNCLGYPPMNLNEVTVKPARSDKDMRPKKEKAKREDHESEEDKLKREIDEDSEKAI